MTETTYNAEMIKQYLLDVLPPAETERLDELSISDAGFAEALSAAENELIDAYVLGELADEARRQFEKSYLSSPQKREKVQFAHALQLFGERETSRSPIQKRTQLIARTWFSSLSSVLRPRAALQWGFAVVVLILLVAGSWLTFRNMRLHRAISEDQARRNEVERRHKQLQKELDAQHSINTQAEQELARIREQLQREQKAAQERAASQQGPSSPTGAILSLVLTPQLRSGTQAPTVSLKPGTSGVAVKLILEPNTYSTYRVTLLDQAQQHTIWQSGLLKAHPATAGKAVNISLPANLLKSHSYLLRVTGIAGRVASEVISDYPFTVVK